MTTVTAIESDVNIWAWRHEPSLMMEDCGFAPDAWQTDILNSTDDRIILLCSRQTGKSTTCAIMALHRAIVYPESLCLMFAPTLRQAQELFTKASTFYRILDKPIPAVKQTETTLVLANGSRIICLPGSHQTIRGYSRPSLVILDEAAQIEDSLFHGVIPMLDQTGRILLVSTPYGRRGFFYDQYMSADQTWTRVTVKATDCPRKTPEFLRMQRLLLGEREYKQEHLCSFEETFGQVFDTDSVMKMLVPHERDRDLRPVKFNWESEST